MKRFAALSLSLILLFCILPGCQKVIDVKREITVLTDEFQGVFNPIFAESKGDIAVCDLLFDSVVEISESGDVIAGLADFEVQEQGCRYRFKLKNACFSNGTKIKASDVLFTLKVIADESYNGSFDLSKSGIVGFNDYKNNNAGEIIGFEISEDNGFDIVLEKANPGFLSSLSFGILSEEYYGKEYKKGDVSSLHRFDTMPCGSGQYILKSYDANKVVLKANEGYFKGQPDISGVIVKNAGKELPSSEFGILETDFAAGIIDKIPGHGAYYVKNFACNVFYNLGFNCKDTLFSDEDIRLAVSLVVNFENLSERICGSRDGIPEVLNKAEDDVSGIDKATEILKEKGYVKNANGFFAKNSKVLEFTVSYEKGKRIEGNLAKQLEADFESFGISVELKEVKNLKENLPEGKEQSFIICTEDGGKYFGASSFKTDSAENIYGFSSAEFDKYLEGYNKNALSYGMKEIISEKAPCLPIYSKIHTVFCSKDIPKIYASAYRSAFKNLYSIELHK